MARISRISRSALLFAVASLARVSLGCSSDGDVSPQDDAGDVRDASGGGHDANAPSDANAGIPDASDASSDAAPPPVDAGPPAIRLLGRFDESNPAKAVAEWSGSAMQARFSGTSASVHLSGGTHYYAVVVDGVLQPVLSTNADATYPLAQGLAPGEHEVLVFRRDEASFGPTEVHAFDFGDGGALLPPPPAATRRIEVIGDSISCGFGNECGHASDAFSQATENEYIAYGPLAARALGADIHVIAWSGKGMYRNLDGKTTETVPILWQRTIPEDATSTWDPSKWIPDAVVINLGTNDINAGGADPSAQFQATYLQFVTKLRAVYPNAFLFGAVGPMLGGGGYTTVKTAITNVVAARKAAGDARLALVEFHTQDCGADGSGCGCGAHPNAAEHQKMATILQDAMHQALGW